MFERLVCQQNLDEFLRPSMLGMYKVRNGYALHVRVLYSGRYAVTHFYSQPKLSIKTNETCLTVNLQLKNIII